MKTIQVEVTPAQEEYLEAIAGQFGGRRPGDMLLAMGFASMAYAEGDDDGRTEVFLSALTQFVVRRHLPAMDPSDMFKTGVSSRPAPALTAPTSSGQSGGAKAA